MAAVDSGHCFRHSADRQDFAMRHMHAVGVRQSPERGALQARAAFSGLCILPYDELSAILALPIVKAKR